MRVLGVDFGRRRIGLALSDRTGLLASPWLTLPASSTPEASAADLARLCRMLLADGTLDGQRIMQPTTVRLMWTRSAEGNGSRALGWDISSTFSRTASICPRSTIRSNRSP